MIFKGDLTAIHRLPNSTLIFRRIGALTTCIKISSDQKKYSRYGSQHSRPIKRMCTILRKMLVPITVDIAPFKNVNNTNIRGISGIQCRRWSPGSSQLEVFILTLYAERGRILHSSAPSSSCLQHKETKKKTNLYQSAKK